MSRPVSAQTLYEQNLVFAGTNGISQNNCRQRFVPAFRDEDTGRVELARFANGKLAPAHLIIGLPAEWATAWSEEGYIMAVKGSITAGFVRDSRFFTREEAAAAV